MGDYRRLALLVVIMIVVCLIIGATAIGVIYEAALDRERARLVNTAQSQARLMEAFARLDAPTQTEGEQPSTGALSQILEAHRRLREQGVSNTAELQLARREGDLIEFVTPARGSDQPHDPVAFSGPAAAPMTAALSGRSGSMIGRDYAGRRVLAAFEPVPDLGLGLVAKIDMREINRRYLRAGAISTLVSLAAVLGAALLFFQVGEPMVRRLRESELRYRNLVEAQPDPICQFLPDTTLTFVNRAYADFYGRKPGDLVGKRWLDFAPKDERPRFLDELTSFTPEQPERHEETRSTRADREVRWYLCHLYGFFDEAGNILSFQTFGTDITVRKRAEQQLAQQLGLLTAITNSAADAIFVVNSEERVAFVNPAAEQIFGWSREELVGRKLHETIHDPHPDSRPYSASESPLSRIYATGEPLIGHEDVFVRKNGSLVPVACSNAPLVIEDQIAGSVLIAHDITARKRAEATLRESELRMRSLLDASQDEILLLSAAGEVLAINNAAKRRLARRTGGLNLVGIPLEKLLPLDQVEHRMAVVRQVAATAMLAHCEVQIRSRWFEFWFYPVLEVDKPVAEVAVYAREITDQKKSQAELSKLFQAVQQSPMSVVITARDGNIEYVNPEFTKVTGYTLDEVIGRNPRILKSGHTSPEQYAELWTTISSGGVWRGEFLNRKKSGELFWELASIAPVKDGQEITNFVAVKEDITERRDIEEQLRQSQKMQAVGQLTGGIAHDFNNLLAIIMGNLQLLQARVGDDHKAREYLDDALWSAKRGGELTHRLLAFARKQPLKPAVIDLNETVRGMTDLLRRTLGGSIRIEESLNPDLWKAVADPGELERALVNLAVNSRDAMQGVGTLTLETRNALLDEDYAEQYEELTPGEYVLLAVTDTGTGMSPEVVSRAFEPFFTTKEVGQGSGLGLSMVYGFIKQSGGHISIYTRIGQGTSVKLYLPRAPFLSGQSRDDPPDHLSPEFGEKLVLVVEDETKLRKAAVNMLERLGLRSMQAGSAEDALRLLAGTHVDVLFTDIELPGGMNGTELADAAQELDPFIRVLFTTGYARDAVLHDKWLHEKVPWLLKPYSHQELGRELKALLATTVH